MLVENEYDRSFMLTFLPFLGRHLQVSGTKVWHLRMTEELKRSVGIASERIVRCDVVCNPGDVIFINTRLWWHQTR